MARAGARPAPAGRVTALAIGSSDWLGGELLFFTRFATTAILVSPALDIQQNT